MPRQPSRGEIWFLKLHTDPPTKGLRPAVVVSLDARNFNPRANSVLIVPLSTSPRRLSTQIELLPGETGLAEVSIARAEEISAVPKDWLVEPRFVLRRLSEFRLRQMANAVLIAMGFSTPPAPSTQRP